MFLLLVEGLLVTLITQESRHSSCGRSKPHPSMPHPHKMSDINFGTQGRNVCMGFCKKVSVCKLQRGEYLIRHDFGKNSLLARAMEDTSPFARAPKNAIYSQSRPPHNPPTPMWVSRDCRVRNNFVQNTASAIGVWLHPFSVQNGQVIARTL